jgi:hypothetical protein
MYIIWGTKRRDEVLGVVGDWCEECGKVRKFTVLKHYQVPHIYWIPLGRWGHVATIRYCWRCGTEFYCRTKKYDDFLPEAERLPAAEVVRLTNGRRMDELGAGNPRAASVICPHCETEFRPSLPRGELICPGCEETLAGR